MDNKKAKALLMDKVRRIAQC